MIYESLAYWALLAVTGASFALTPARALRLRAAAVALASVLVLMLTLDLSPAFGLTLLASLVWMLIAVRLAGREAPPPLFVLLAPVAAVWVSGKLASALEPDWVHLIGFSYFFIKSWTLLKDVCDGRIKDPEPALVLAYFLFFPTFISGPMHLYGEFERGVRALKFPGAEELIDVVLRVLLGLVKLKVLAPLLAPVSLEALAATGQISFAALAVGSIAYSIVIWANFSGYTDLAIATSRLLGVHTPENFNYPYAAPNIREFWQRWHITFTRVLSSYVFIPLSRRLQPHLGDHPKALMVVCTLVTFVFCGFWHGATLNFLVWGLYHALGLIIYDVYRPGATRRRARRKGSPHAALIDRAERAGGIVLTFAFVSVGWIFFVFPMSRLLP